MIFIGLLIGIALGVGWRELHVLALKVHELQKKSEEKSAVTSGSYWPANETKQTPAIINPKTPQQMEALESERLRRTALGLDVRDSQR